MPKRRAATYDSCQSAAHCSLPFDAVCPTSWHQDPRFSANYHSFGSPSESVHLRRMADG